MQSLSSTCKLPHVQRPCLPRSCINTTLTARLWLCRLIFDDERVSRIGREAVITSDTYIIFLQKRQ
jgi:hypothetical protein